MVFVIGINIFFFTCAAEIGLIIGVAVVIVVLLGTSLVIGIVMVVKWKRAKRSKVKGQLLGNSCVLKYIP